MQAAYSLHHGIAGNRSMADINREEGFISALHQQKHERVARGALHNLFLFHDDLRKEISRFENAVPETEAERAILERMKYVEECYFAVMHSLQEESAQREQHKIVCFSDALLDLMKLIYQLKGQA